MRQFLYGRKKTFFFFVFLEILSILSIPFGFLYIPNFICYYMLYEGIILSSFSLYFLISIVSSPLVLDLVSCYINENYLEKLIRIKNMCNRLNI